ncbi:hypothetical protein EB796_009591 [Bugula neritina]|uniref:Nucleosome assembly protein 1-like 1 n=1 Tax=Bugula neritina TaxID=10212 RepID=A0A7J7K2A5_BUGNE|nr:hypothetical protein EB796_009591 [Bugula neritina]
MNVQLELNSDPMGFTLLFEFDENEYFTDKVLTKTYTMQSSADENDPFGFEGPEIISCKGCSIHWKEGKNVTLMNMKKKQKNAKTGNIRIVTKEVQVDSFFNFFSPPEVPEDPSAEIDADVEALLQADFQIGHFIRERIVPHAVLYFTGDIDTDDEEDGEGDDDMDEDYEDYDEECDPDYDPSKDVQGGKDCKSQ